LKAKKGSFYKESADYAEWLQLCKQCTFGPG
jgi:hypothetical protein